MNKSGKYVIDKYLFDKLTILDKENKYKNLLH